MINTPDYNNYRNGDLLQYLLDLLVFFHPEVAAELNVTNQHTPLKELTNTFAAKWKPLEGSEMTPALAALDAERDRAITGYRNTVTNWAENHFKPEKRNAAFVIADMLAGHGDYIDRMRYQLQTATLNAIVQDLSSVHADENTLLGLGDWVVEIKRINDAFADLHRNRTQELSLVEKGLIETLRVQCIEALRKLIKSFNSRATIAEDENSPLLERYKSIAAQWNQHTKLTDEAVNRFKGTDDGTNGSTPPATPPTPPPAEPNA